MKNTKHRNTSLCNKGGIHTMCAETQSLHLAKLVNERQVDVRKGKKESHRNQRPSGAGPEAPVTPLLEGAWYSPMLWNPLHNVSGSREGVERFNYFVRSNPWSSSNSSSTFGNSRSIVVVRDFVGLAVWAGTGLLLGGTTWSALAALIGLDSK